MKTALIVDDQRSVLLTLESILTKEGFAVISCTNSIDAFDHIQREKFDLVITDAIMPLGSSGYNLISTIRTQENMNSKVPILMLTGRSETTDVEKAIQVGANDYMVKPVDPDVLISKIQRLLAQSDNQSDFVHAPVNLEAAIHIKVIILTTSEIGLKFMSEKNLDIGQIYKISSEFFNIFEKDTVSVRVNGSEKSANQFSISANYVGLSEKELSHIRTWVRNKLINK